MSVRMAVAVGVGIGIWLSLLMILGIRVTVRLLWRQPRPTLRPTGVSPADWARGASVNLPELPAAWSGALWRGSRLRVYIEPRDCWVGVYVAREAIYVCPLPFVVIRWWRR